MYMEDVGRISSESCELIMSRLDKFKLNINEKELKNLIENKLFDVIFSTIECICINDYKNHL